MVVIIIIIIVVWLAQHRHHYCRCRCRRPLTTSWFLIVVVFGVAVAVAWSLGQRRHHMVKAAGFSTFVVCRLQVCCRTSSFIRLFVCSLRIIRMVYSKNDNNKPRDQHTNDWRSINEGVNEHGTDKMYPQQICGSVVTPICNGFSVGLKWD